MSARAIRKLREDREAALAAAAEGESDDDSDEGGNNITITNKGSKMAAFAMMNDSSSSSSSEEEEEEEENNEVVGEDANATKEEEPSTNAPSSQPQPQLTEEKDLDALLEEFKEHDDKKPPGNVLGDAKDGSQEAAVPAVLLIGIDARDLDSDYVMRTSMLTAEPETAAAANNSKNKRRNRQTFLFGNPRDWNNNGNVKPPHYVGGGIGMATYDRDTETHRSIPWPYNHENGLSFNNASDTLTESTGQDRTRWYTFINSDSYDKDCLDFKRIQESGDMNALVLFVAHHPFVTEALVILAMMLYHSNQAGEGLTFLKRAMWVYETATMTGFTARVFDDQCFMDYDQPENQNYFDLLFQLARVNHMSR